MHEFKKRVILDIVPPLHRAQSLPLRPRLGPSLLKKSIDIKKSPEVFDKELLKKKSRAFKFFKPSFSKIKIILLALLIFLAYAALGAVFSEMKIEIIPKKVLISLDETIDIVFSEISLSDKRGDSFSASEKKLLESKAKGIITVFNKNSNSQVLVAGTRFESPSGKIYKIEKGIVVLGNSSLDTEVVAYSVGAEFNEDNLIDFTIPGFKEQRSPKFNTIYAKSKTKITGGFSGATFVIREEDVKKAKSNLLKDAAMETAQSLTRKTPDDSFLLAQSIKYSVLEEKSEPKVGEAGEKFTLEIMGTAKGIVVPQESLEKILGRKIPDYDSSISHFKINNIENLSFSVLGAGSNSSDLKIKVRGTAEFIGDLDEESIRDDIFKKKQKTSSAILEALPVASWIKVHFRPFWLRSFPENKERIDIKIRQS